MRSPAIKLDDAPARTFREIAAALGVNRQRAQHLYYRAIKKIRNYPGRLERFRAAVAEKRYALDARTPQQPWTDIDASPE